MLITKRDNSKFAWIKEFENRHAEIKDELMKLRSNKGFQPYRGPSWSGSQKEEDGVGVSSHEKGAWNVFYLQLHSMEFMTNVEKVPLIMSLINKHIPRGFNHCFISALTPGTHILPHYGSNNKKLRFHFPIIGCEGASLRAGKQTVNLEEGAFT